MGQSIFTEEKDNPGRFTGLHFTHRGGGTYFIKNSSLFPRGLGTAESSLIVRMCTLPCGTYLISRREVV